tara:strand:- start:1890 stop:2636 length:747 start_codon:yes stop_codon:yes gene_type:complete
MTGELKSANSVKTGKKFSERRNEIGYTIDKVSEILFVNKDYIVAIEKGNYSIFPSESFAKAYFKKYKNFLNLSAEFPDLFNQHKEKKHKKISNEIAFENNFDFIIKNTNIIIALTLVIGIGIYYFLSNAESISDNTPQENIKSEYLSEIIENVNNNKDFISNSEKIGNNNLIIEFYGESWIELYRENQLVEAQIFSNGDIYQRKIEMPFKIIVGNADFVKGTYNSINIDFMTNANRLTKVNTINFPND